MIRFLTPRGANICLLVALGVIVMTATAGAKDVITKSFPAHDRVRINTVSGDCIISVWDRDAIDVEITSDVHPADAWEPQFDEGAGGLRLSEEHFGSDSGPIEWRIQVPAETEIRFSTASGDFEARGLKGDLSVETASGNVTLEHCESDIEVSTASGNIDLSESSGRLEISTASGDIKARALDGSIRLSAASGDIDADGLTGEMEISSASGDVSAEAVRLTDASSFSSASGETAVTLADSPQHDIEVSSSSGTATLDFDGHPIVGSVEMYARYREGDITADIGFDHEEKVHLNGQRYVVKKATLDKDSPMIVIRTGSGEAELRK